MKKILSISAFFIFMAVSAQNFQLHNDFERGYLTTTFELFKVDKYGNTYTFIRSDSSDAYAFNIGTSFNQNNSEMHIQSTGSGPGVSGNYNYEYPLSVNGTAKIKKHLLVERDLSLNGAISMGSVVYQF